MFQIFEIDERKIEYEGALESKELIGRLLSGMYTFVDGHIYYKNNVYKIRYDLVAKSGTRTFTEHDIFDFYPNIFDMRSNIKVRSNTPLDSPKSHRFGYITQDAHFEQSKKVIIVPYLHERRIYLNRIKQNT